MVCSDLYTGRDALEYCGITQFTFSDVLDRSHQPRVVALITATFSGRPGPDATFAFLTTTSTFSIQNVASVSTQPPQLLAISTSGAQAHI